jgi:dTDP-4-dehydrorhamnose reductase
VVSADKLQQNAKGVLIIGADSLIGNALMKAYKNSEIPVYGTSRKKSATLIFLDLAETVDFSVLPAVDTVFFCAAINSFAACNDNPALAAKVNIVAPLMLAEHYFKQGTHFIFLSSTAVFAPDCDKPSEQDKLAPVTIYGAFKCATEIALKEQTAAIKSLYTIVRLTKVLSPASPLLKRWRELTQTGHFIEAFCDAYVSPISLDYVVKGLLAVAAGKFPGCFHLSGATCISYEQLAYALCERGLLPDAKVKSMSANLENGKNLMSRQCVSLGMSETTRKLGLFPQPFEDFLKEMA